MLKNDQSIKSGQIFSGYLSIWYNRNHYGNPASQTNCLDTVSYTHLDVYKRQLEYHPA